MPTFLIGDLVQEIRRPLLGEAFIQIGSGVFLERLGHPDEASISPFRHEKLPGGQEYLAHAHEAGCLLTAAH